MLAFEVSRVREMLALTTLDYSAQARPPCRTSLPNVFVVNSAQIVNGTLNVNETVGAGQRRRGGAPALPDRAARRRMPATAVA